MASYFDRQMLLPGFGEKGQSTLLNTKVLIVGLGGLGCPASLYLTTSGIGELSLLDGDIITESNLHRQVLFSKNDVGEKKVKIATMLLKEHAIAETKFYPVDKFFNFECEDIIDRHDIVIDCTDNLRAKFLLNDLCVLKEKKYIYASIYKFGAQIALFNSPYTGCLRCVFPEMVDRVLLSSCQESGVLPSIVGIVGNMQALEAIKSIVYPNTINNIFKVYDFLANDYQNLSYEKNKNCKVCSHRINIDEIKSLNESPENKIIEIPYSKLTDYSDALLIDVRTLAERSKFNIGGEHFPLDTLESNFNKLPKNKKIILYCEKGVRSKLAAKILKNNGFNKAFTLKGGVSSQHE